MSTSSLADITRSSISPLQSGLHLANLKRLLANWRWTALSLIICFVTGFVFLRYSTPKYEIEASILVKDDSKGTDLGEAALLESLGLTSGKNNVDNEVEILKSRTLMESVVNDLQLYVQYFASGNIKTTEIYEKSPVSFKMITLNSITPGDVQPTYLIKFTDNGRFNLSDNLHTWQQSFGDTFRLPVGLVVLTKTPFKPISTDTYSIRVSGSESITNVYSQQLSVSATNKLVSIINLKLTEILPSKGEAILKKLIENYLNASIADKNRIADSTITFIDENLKLVSEELLGIEKQIEKFRTTNRVTDIKEQNKLLLGNTSRYDQERMMNEVQLKEIESFRAFVSDNTNGTIPSSIVTQQPDFQAMIEQYNSLQRIRDRTLLSNTIEHPTVQNLDLQLSKIKEGFIASINSKKRELQSSSYEIKKYVSKSQDKIDQIPGKERVFLDFARKQEIKQELYVFLLKKRIETSISRSTTLANGRIIDAPKAEAIPISPNKSLILAIALLLGLGFPIGFLYIRDIFNTTITDKNEITSLLPLPILAEIGHNTDPDMKTLQLNNRGHIAEQFRTLRTNLQFLISKGNEQAILVTSSVSGEGKTFVALNLCNTLQLTGKKVVLVEFDLRRPKIAEYFGITGPGLSEYLTMNIPIEEIIGPSNISANFDIITAGIPPMQPAELMLSPKTETLITSLKEKYDYLVIDSAPIGLVTDATLLSRFVNMTLFVIRQEFTTRDQLDSIVEISKNKLLPKLNIILNDVKTLSQEGYANGYYSK